VCISYSARGGVALCADDRTELDLSIFFFLGLASAVADWSIELYSFSLSGTKLDPLHTFRYLLDNFPMNITDFRPVVVPSSCEGCQMDKLKIRTTLTRPVCGPPLDGLTSHTLPTTGRLPS
jgi:hypothetical protein